MIHNDHRKWTSSHWNVHHASNCQSITGIIDQVTGIKLIFILERGANVDLPILVNVLTQSINRVRIDQFVNVWRWTRRKSLCWNWRRSECLNRNMRGRQRSCGRYRHSLTSHNTNKNKQAYALFHKLIVSFRNCEKGVGKTAVIEITPLG